MKKPAPPRSAVLLVTVLLRMLAFDDWMRPRPPPCPAVELPSTMLFWTTGSDVFSSQRPPPPTVAELPRTSLLMMVDWLWLRYSPAPRLPLLLEMTLLSIRGDALVRRMPPPVALDPP